MSGDRPPHDRLDEDLDDGDFPDDPVYVHARREALVVFLAWLVAGIVTISVSVWLGYDVDPEEVTLILGIPSWVVLGVIVPWMLAVAFGAWFSLRYIVEDDLGSDPEEPPHE